MDLLNFLCEMSFTDDKDLWQGCSLTMYKVIAGSTSYELRSKSASNSYVATLEKKRNLVRGGRILKSILWVKDFGMAGGDGSERFTTLSSLIPTRWLLHIAEKGNWSTKEVKRKAYCHAFSSCRALACLVHWVSELAPRMPTKEGGFLRDGFSWCIHFRCGLVMVYEKKVSCYLVLSHEDDVVTVCKGSSCLARWL